MYKNALFTLLTLSAFAATPCAYAADADEPVPIQALDEPPVQGLAPQPLTPAQPQTAPAQPIPAQDMPVATPLPAHDNHTDYRYCLELKTNLEIIQCRYKKK